ncbi:MAG: BLUF domain-containing protein, partial [Candidatus Thiodiazotropha taylori]|nr:BLUF domain-containing protein [Candidatus Thiodiazotropha taylori]MCW4243231.1 BLUF domain-containing protein [Candidatus Thiodiazotropha taylori]
TELLEQARNINELEDITGLLLYKDGSFVQVLEGYSENVVKIYRRIQHDDRHHQVKTLYQQAIQERDFPDWRKGFQNLSDADFEPPAGFSRFMEADYALEQFLDDPTRARRLMLFFRAKS